MGVASRAAAANQRYRRHLTTPNHQPQTFHGRFLQRRGVRDQGINASAEQETGSLFNGASEVRPTQADLLRDYKQHKIKL